MRYRDLISEAPIADFEIAGDLDTQGSFQKDDLKKLRDPAWKERVVRLFQRSPFVINLYIVNGDPEGKIKRTGKNFIDKTNTRDIKSYVGIQSRAWAAEVLGHEVGESDISCMLFSNEGSARVGLTPWMVAHRMAHCFIETNTRYANEKLQVTANSVMLTGGSFMLAMDRYINDPKSPKYANRDRESDEAMIAKHAAMLSNFRSARTGNLRDSGEYMVELFAQFLINGKVEFKTDWITGPRREPIQHTPLEDAVLRGTKNQGWAFFQYAQHEYALEALFKAMKGDPLRPRTKAALQAVVAKMDREGRDHYRPKGDWTAEERMHYKLEEFAATLNEQFTDMLKLAQGSVVVL